MNYILELTILMVGLSGLAGQVLLLRELLVSFCGSELTLGIVLANWVISEASGVFIIGRYIDRIKNKAGVFIFLEIVFSLALPLTIYAARTFKNILGLTYGEGLGLPVIFASSFLILFTLSFCHGGLFSAGCKIYSLRIKDSAASIGKVYAWETLGTIIGGIILTYVFIPYLNSFQAAFIVSVVNLIVCLILIKDIPSRKLKYVTLAAAALMSYLLFNGAPDYLHRLSVRQQYRRERVLDYRNSVYGNITLTKREEQYTFFYNGVPVITSPYPDITFVEEFGHLPLLFHEAPQDILVIGSGAGGLINEILKHPVRKIDYAELDPLIIEMLKEHPTGLTAAELSDRRVRVINLDARFFLRTASDKYDVVLIGLSASPDLASNRLFTREFFSLVREKLNPGGILGFWLPGSLTYLSRELKDLNMCILNALRSSYGYVRVIPGDYNIFLASSRPAINSVSADLISQRMAAQNIKTNILIPDYLCYRLEKRWLDWFMKSSKSATVKINQDLSPVAVFETFLLANKKFSPGFASLLSALQDLDLRAISIFIFLTGLLFFYVFSRSRSRKGILAYSIATTGFFGMAMNLVLIFGFQVFYGYLYYKIGILMSIFMAGIALGSIFMTAAAKEVRDALGLFRKLEILIIVFSCIAALTLTRLTLYQHYVSLIFISLFFVSGLLVGLEFPLAGRIYLKERGGVGEVSGLLYAADLLGSWVAGIFGGIIFLPLLGLFNTCIVIAMLKLTSLIFLLLFRE
jgi:spermidine synthase